MCSNKTKTSTWPAKQITSHVQNRTRTRSQWNTQAVCHTAQDITWMHAADKNTNCMQHHKTHVDRRLCGRANSRPHTHIMTQNTERECPNPDKKPKLKTWVPGSEHHAPTQNKACMQHTHIKTGHDGSVRALSQNPWMTPDRSDRSDTYMQTFCLLTCNAVRAYVCCHLFKTAFNKCVSITD